MLAEQLRKSWHYNLRKYEPLNIINMNTIFLSRTLFCCRWKNPCQTFLAKNKCKRKGCGGRDLLTRVSLPLEVNGCRDSNDSTRIFSPILSPAFCLCWLHSLELPTNRWHSCRELQLYITVWQPKWNRVFQQIPRKGLWLAQLGWYAYH